jgi:hypothetical protein
MEWIEQGLLALAIGLPAVLGLMLVMMATRLTRLRLPRRSLRIVAKKAVPGQVRLSMEKAQPLLSGLGFQYRYTTASERVTPTGGDSPLFTDVYQHLEGHTHALASLSLTPEQGQPCTVMWVTLFQSGKIVATVNGYRHNLLSAPAGWVMYDDYLPDVRTVWERHRRRITAEAQSVVQDGVEFFWTTKQATEQLMPHCEKKGLLVRQNDHWQMPWRVALPFAWKLFIGQRKVAKLRSRSGPGLPGPAKV